MKYQFSYPKEITMCARCPLADFERYPDRCRITRNEIEDMHLKPTTCPLREVEDVKGD